MGSIEKMDTYVLKIAGVKIEKKVFQSESKIWQVITGKI